MSRSHWTAVAAFVCASCANPATPSQTVTVLPPGPHLSAMTILAFGDSITEGDVGPDKSYPADLVGLLEQRYSSQAITRIDAICDTTPLRAATTGVVVINAGCAGEPAAASTTLSRLDRKLSAYQPDVVLLLEGVNDLNASVSIATAVEGVRALIMDAQNHGARVLVGTLLPEIPGLVHAGSASLILPFNAQLVAVAGATSAIVVDLYSDLTRDVADWISPADGLHPTQAGYQEIARVWFTALQGVFEVQQFASPTASMVPHPNRSSR